MLFFPKAKIILGLRILRKRKDGYHELSTIMIPVGWTDILEVVPGKSRQHTLSIGGSNIPQCRVDDNLVMKAVHALERHLGSELPPLDIYLEKIIPFGAGLGGGSSDASYTLIAVNELLALGITPDALAEIATSIGADCPFFIRNYYTGQPQLAEGIGERLNPVEIPGLENLYIAIAKPESSAIPTKEAYAGVNPAELEKGETLTACIAAEPETWQRSALINDFERSIFPGHPEIQAIKEHFLNHGAIYSAMSGSGAAVFGLFRDNEAAQASVDALDGCQTYTGRL
ncbi:MAG: 4-(cytidine 5'-diphospho)-2-C-methyl-D-erythritol kinase [Muribaculaceae bacterium]|nr:4-(cytidine 5'-diphospho)-2-C-methyl-D-erythritol kinase [Muribaculaceae bacterium]